MKKYIAPAVELQQTEVFQMMALSLQGGTADADKPVLSTGDEWNVWEDAEEAE